MDLRQLACWDCGFESRRGLGCLSVVSVVCCQVEVCVASWSLVQRSTTECGMSERDHESSIMNRPCPTGGCLAMEKIGHTITCTKYPVKLQPICNFLFPCLFWTKMFSQQRSKSQPPFLTLNIPRGGVLWGPQRVIFVILP